MKPREQSTSPISDERIPTHFSTSVFTAKAALLKLRRTILDVGAGTRKWPRCEASGASLVLAESRTALWSEETVSERRLQLGKVQNLRCALHQLDGIAIPANRVFSFWKQIGRPIRSRGFVAGRQLREGCIYPAIGGGLCQLSNALYDLALTAGIEIVERHPHTRIIPGSAAAAGRDATVAWNYIDLRFRADRDIRLEARLSRDQLILRLHGAPVPLGRTSAISSKAATFGLELCATIDPMAHTCSNCAQTSCFRHQSILFNYKSARERTAYILDEKWPEFERYLAATHVPGDVLLIPIDGTRWKMPRHRWDTRGYSEVRTASVATAIRGLRSRNLAKYGALRLQSQIDDAAAIAGILGRQIPFDATRVCVTQSLLPFLWREHHLGGREFDVLMTRLPLRILHARLDAAVDAHPDRPTLAEFRAPDWMVDAEHEALEAADQIVTPHSQIGGLFGSKSRLLPWECNDARNPGIRGGAIAFPGPTAARKGAYEVREAARTLPEPHRGQKWIIVLPRTALAVPWPWPIARTAQSHYRQETCRPFGSPTLRSGISDGRR